MFWLGLTTAFAASDRENWEALGDALLLEAEDGDLATAVTRYQSLVRNLADDDPVRAEALYWLGHGRWLLGDVALARDALDDCIRLRAYKTRCGELRTEIEIEVSAVHATPVHWTFDDAEYGVVHPWAHAAGTLRLEVPPGEADPILVWTPESTAENTDHLVVGFDHPTPAPKTVAMNLRTFGGRGFLRIHALDAAGRDWSLTSPVTVDATPREVVVTLADLRGEDPAARLDAATIVRLEIEEWPLGASARERAGAYGIDDFRVE